MPTKQELQDLADEHGIEVPASATKAELVDALKAEGVDVLAETGEDDDVEDGENGDTGDDTASTDVPPASGDPALFDPQSLSQAHEGTANDPASREEGAEVEPAPTVGAQASEGGQPTGDVEVALLDDTPGEGEWRAPLNVEDWVVLDGSHDEVPDRLDGHIAYVIEAKAIPAPDSSGGPNGALMLDEEEPIKVRTRDEADAILVIPLDAVKAVGRGGRSALQPTG